MNRLFPLFFLAIAGTFWSCSNDDDDVDESAAPYSLFAQWGVLGNDEGELSNVAQIKASSNYVYIRDFDNDNVQRFDYNGNYLGQLPTEDPFYVYQDRLYLFGDSTGKYVVKDSAINAVNIYDLEMNFIESKSFQGDVFTAADMAGNDEIALLTTGSSYAPFLTSLNYSSGAMEAFGSLGTSDLEFDWNGYLAVTYEGGEFLIADPGNNRIQVLNSDFEFVQSFSNLKWPSKQINSPDAIGATSSIIVVGAGGSSGEPVNFYNRGDVEFKYEIDTEDKIVDKVAAAGDYVFVVVSGPSVMVYKKD